MHSALLSLCLWMLFALLWTSISFDWKNEEKKNSLSISALDEVSACVWAFKELFRFLCKVQTSLSGIFSERNENSDRQFSHDSLFRHKIDIGWPLANGHVPLSSRLLIHMFIFQIAKVTGPERNIENSHVRQSPQNIPTIDGLNRTEFKWINSEMSKGKSYRSICSRPNENFLDARNYAVWEF